TGMHPDTANDAHKIRHGRTLEMCARRLWIFRIIDVWHYNIVAGIDVITVSAGGVLGIFLDDLILAGRSVQAFTAGRQLRDANQLSAFEKVGALLPETDLDRRFPRDSVAIPIRNVIHWRARTDGRIPIDATEILGLSIGQPRVLLSAAREGRTSEKNEAHPEAVRQRKD